MSTQLLERPALMAASGWSDDEEVETVPPSPTQRLARDPMKPATVDELIRNLAVGQGVALEAFEALMQSWADLFVFHPEIRYADDGRVYAWLHEFDVYGEG